MKLRGTGYPFLIFESIDDTAATAAALDHYADTHPNVTGETGESARRMAEQFRHMTEILGAAARHGAAADARTSGFGVYGPITDVALSALEHYSQTGPDNTLRVAAEAALAGYQTSISVEPES